MSGTPDADRLFGQPPAASAPADPGQADRTAFSHSSERLFARLLDFYGIRWQYEPRRFDLDVDDQGNATEQFTPDFYLPDFDLYVEVTTMSQKLVTRKNRKIRRLGERYPEVRCRIFYQRDIDRLATKHHLDVPREDYTGNGSGE